MARRAVSVSSCLSIFSKTPHVIGHSYPLAEPPIVVTYAIGETTSHLVDLTHFRATGADHGERDQHVEGPSVVPWEIREPCCLIAHRLNHG